MEKQNHSCLHPLEMGQTNTEDTIPFHGRCMRLLCLHFALSCLTKHRGVTVLAQFLALCDFLNLSVPRLFITNIFAYCHRQETAKVCTVQGPFQ